MCRLEGFHKAGTERGGGWRGKSFTAALFRRALPLQAGSGGVHGLQILNICMWRASEEKMVTNAIKVSFTSRGASTLGAKHDASSQPLFAPEF